MSSLYPVKRKAPEIYTSEFDILKSAHRFLRDDKPEATQSWDAQLAKKYEDTLFKEFAVCDLKHYKSGNVALRWRTEDEVVSGAGETTCGNTRCPHHDALNDSTKESSKRPKLTTMELPFSYTEQGETEARQVMVKVVLCQRCVKKLMWKREKDKAARERDGPSDKFSRQEENETGQEESRRKGRERSREHHRSRSRSPRRHR